LNQKKNTVFAFLIIITIIYLFIIIFFFFGGEEEVEVEYKKKGQKNIPIASFPSVFLKMKSN